MLHLIFKLISLFISNNNGKRQKFLKRFDVIERMKAFIKDNKMLALDVKRENRQNYFFLLKDKNFAYTMTYNYAFEAGFVNNYKEHLENEKKLKNNLSEEALTNLNGIIKLFETAAKYPVKSSELWLKDIYIYIPAEYYKELDFCKEIERINDYYQYKQYKLPVNFFQASLFLYHNGMHKLKTLDTMKDDEVIIDAGFCIGDSALIMRDFTKNKIIGFEPTEENIELAKKTISLNKLDNIQIEKYGLGNKNCIAYFNFSPSDAYDIGAVAIIENGDKRNKCEIITLDDYVKKHHIKVGLIKSDIEGFELKLLEGAIETIKTQKPRLLISIYHNYNDFYKIKPWIEALNLGYEFDFYHGLYAEPVIETLLIAEVK